MGAEEYLSNGVFSVTLYGMELSFSRVSGLAQSVEYDAYPEGGGGIVIMPKPSSAAGTVTFEKGVTSSKWAQAGCFSLGVKLRDITVTLMKNGSAAERYSIESGIVTAWELGELNGLGGGVLIRKFTLAHTGIRIS